MSDTMTAVERINYLRNKVINHEEVTQEELAEAIKLIRAQRSTSTDAKKSTSAKSIPLDLNDLFKPKE